ncbi:MAG: hypothetical protein MK110_04250 [Fuerstiella sp.]|nr:hypothetical protein [Fuerstiella sp.]
MNAFIELMQNLVVLFWSLLSVAISLFEVILPWLPLMAWIAFWTLAVNWVTAFDAIRRGGWIGVLLLMFAAVLVWGAVAPPVAGHHVIFSLNVDNYPGKFFYVTALTCIAFLCGSAQMNGLAQSLVRFDNPPEESASH